MIFYSCLPYSCNFQFICKIVSFSCQRFSQNFTFNQISTRNSLKSPNSNMFFSSCGLHPLSYNTDSHCELTRALLLGTTMCRKKIVLTSATVPSPPVGPSSSAHTPPDCRRRPTQSDALQSAGSKCPGGGQTPPLAVGTCRPAPGGAGGGGAHTTATCCGPQGAS